MTDSDHVRSVPERYEDIEERLADRTNHRPGCEKTRENIPGNLAPEELAQAKGTPHGGRGAEAGELAGIRAALAEGETANGDATSQPEEARGQAEEELRAEVATALKHGNVARTEFAMARLERKLGEAGPGDRDLSGARASLKTWQAKREQVWERRLAEERRQIEDLAVARRNRQRVMLMIAALVVIAIVLWMTLGHQSPSAALGPARDAGWAGGLWTDPVVGMRFRYIPSGTFSMGSRRREVRLTRGYWLGQTAVTQGQWKTLMGTNPSLFLSCGDGSLPTLRRAPQLHTDHSFRPNTTRPERLISAMGLESTTISTSRLIPLVWRASNSNAMSAISSRSSGSSRSRTNLKRTSPRPIISRIAQRRFGEIAPIIAWTRFRTCAFSSKRVGVMSFTVSR